MRAARLRRTEAAALPVALAFGASAAGRAQAPQPSAAWPNHITMEGAGVTVYQPQAITPPHAKVPILGTVEVSLDTRTDLATRTVFLSDPRLDSSRFPALDTAEAARLAFAVNTNWGVFSDGKQWYLVNNGIWFVASAATGPYAPTAKLPPAFNALPNDANFADERRHIPPRAADAAHPPTILASTKPAEIIVTAGPPRLAPVEGTALQRVQNTAQAQLAMLRAQVPQQATLRRDAAKLNVVYVGTPQFKPTTGYAGRLDSGSYQQLEQDRQARTFGKRQQFGGFRQAGEGGAGRGFGGFGGRFRQ